MKSECNEMTGLLKYIKEKLLPASDRAHKNTKYEFHAGYHKACEDILKKADQISGDHS